MDAKQEMKVEALRAALGANAAKGGSNTAETIASDAEKFLAFLSADAPSAK